MLPATHACHTSQPTAQKAVQCALSDPFASLSAIRLPASRTLCARMTDVIFASTVYQYCFKDTTGLLPCQVLAAPCRELMMDVISRVMRYNQGRRI